MTEIEPNLLALAWFGLLFAITCVAFFLMAGMFPLAARPPAAKARGGLLLILGNLAALLALGVGTALYGWVELRWTSLVIGAGLIFLFTPGLLDGIPARWRDGRTGLFTLLITQAAALSLLYRMAEFV
jgi:hypothetical protein